MVACPEAGKQANSLHLIRALISESIWLQQEQPEDWEIMEAPYKVQVDPEKARELAQSGAIILLLDVPNGTVIGIDQQVSVLSEPSSCTPLGSPRSSDARK